VTLAKVAVLLNMFFRSWFMVGVQPADGQQLFGTLKLPIQETVFGTGSQGQYASLETCLVLPSIAMETEIHEVA